MYVYRSIMNVRRVGLRILLASSFVGGVKGAYSAHQLALQSYPPKFHECSAPTRWMERGRHSVIVLSGFCLGSLIVPHFIL